MYTICYRLIMQCKRVLIDVNAIWTTSSQLQQKLAPNAKCQQVLVLALLTGFTITVFHFLIFKSEEFCVLLEVLRQRYFQKQKGAQLTFPVVTRECRGFGLSFVNDWPPTFSCASPANAALCAAGFVGFSSSSRFVASWAQTQYT